ncbi:transcription initiation factor TFIID subunit 9B isoform X1 [Bos indicus x Bos taurus]|uniref:TATA-box binding protein associated factor 9b n=1 Tax=Bos indicus x Bos taurus TaxID=30522 RepID=A0A4W2GUE6_BOBOX|nr:transcription initiation factor TFIID subunit 9B isoform X1 [Bos indicus x Bos taurus]
MESGKMAPPKNAPRDALVMAQILKDMGITEYEPRVINQMLEFAFRYVTSILDDAKIYSSHAKKPNVDADDVRLAIQCRADQSFTSPPPRDFLLDIARQKNQTPLPLIKPYAGPRLPPDRYCLTAPNYRLKSLIKKGPNQGRLVPRLSVGAVSSRPTTPNIATPQTASVPNKVAPPVSVTSQRFTVQIPPSQSTPVKPGLYLCQAASCQDSYIFLMKATRTSWGREGRWKPDNRKAPQKHCIYQKEEPEGRECS